jgi:Zn-dependent peptidase ImmA (M78 family)
MIKQSILDPAEIWLAKQFLEPNESNIFLSTENPKPIRDEIKKRIFNDVRTLIYKSGQHSPPFNPQKIMKYKVIRKIIWNKNLTHRESMLIPKPDGFYIQANPNHPITRKRFSLAHEIGHTYFFDLGSSPPRKFYPISSSRYWVEEGYACEIAREILMPEPYLSKITCKLTKAPSVHALIKLKSLFNISYEVLIRRLLFDAQLWNSNFWGNSLWNAILITSEILPNDEANSPKIKVYRSPKFKWILKEARNIEQVDNAIKKIFENKDQIDETIEIGKRKIQYNIQGQLCRESPKMAILVITK